MVSWFANGFLAAVQRLLICPILRRAANIMANGAVVLTGQDEPNCNDFLLNWYAIQRRMRTTAARRIRPRCHELDAQRHRAVDRPLPASTPRRATSRSRRAIRTRCAQTLKPGDVLLVEGNNHISGVIKYLTQSTWSHAALYVGPIGERTAADGEPLVLVEANLGEGVIGAPLSKYDALSHAHLPSDRVDRGRPRARLHLRGRAHRLRLRRQEYLRPVALPVARCRCRSAGGGA